MLHFPCRWSCLFTLLLSSQFFWHIRLKSTTYFFDPPCISSSLSLLGVFSLHTYPGHSMLRHLPSTRICEPAAHCHKALKLGIAPSPEVSLIVIPLDKLGLGLIIIAYEHKYKSRDFTIINDTYVSSRGLNFELLNNLRVFYSYQYVGTITSQMMRMKSCLHPHLMDGTHIAQLATSSHS